MEIDLAKIAVASSDGNPPEVGSVHLKQPAFFLGRAYYTYLTLLDRLLRETGLNEHVRPGMGNVLFALFEKDDQIISEVGRRLQLAKSTMTQMAARIRKAGLITTRKCPEDGRAVRLTLTPLGRSLEPKCRDVAERLDQILCRDFSEEERAMLQGMLSTITKSMNDELEQNNNE